MSNHSQRAKNLHHDQVTAGKERRVQCRIERTQNFLAMRGQLRLEYSFMLVCAFICFAYTTIATAVYLGWLI